MRISAFNSQHGYSLGQWPSAESFFRDLRSDRNYRVCLYRPADTSEIWTVVRPLWEPAPPCAGSLLSFDSILEREMFWHVACTQFPRLIHPDSYAMPEPSPVI